MEKILTALGVACVALSGFAASPQQFQDSRINTVKNSCVKDFPKLKKAHTPSGLKKIAPGLSSMTDIIYSATGENQDVSVTTSGLTMSFSGLEAFHNRVLASHVIYGGDNEVYFYNIFADLPTDTYFKGVREGDNIIVDLPQAVYYDDSWGGVEAYYYTLVDIVEGVDDEGYNSISFIPQEKASVTFSVDEFGTMVAQELNENLLFGACDSEDGSWIGLGASAIEISSFDEQPVQLPEGFEVSENFWTVEGDGFGWQVSFAQGAEEIYFQGLCERMPEAWVKGTVEYDDTTATVSIAQDQYVGDYLGYHIFTKCVEMTVDKDGNIFYEDLMDPDYVFQLVWDFEEETMVAKDKNVVLLFNVSKSDVYFVNDLMNLTLIRQESFEGVPQNPYGLAFADEMEEQGYSSFSFFLPAVSTEGDYLKLDDLSYVVYVDGEVWEFDADDYNMEESLEEIPWSFNGNWILKRYGSTEHMVAFFVEGISTLGVQSVYKYDGIETRSEIMTIDLEEVAVDAIKADKEVADVRYFDMTGRELSAPSDGLFIKRITYADGTVASLKKMIR